MGVNEAHRLNGESPHPLEVPGVNRAELLSVPHAEFVEPVELIIAGHVVDCAVVAIQGGSLENPAAGPQRFNLVVNAHGLRQLATELIHLAEQCPQP